jgi:hypothetical protein
MTFGVYTTGDREMCDRHSPGVYTTGDREMCDRHNQQVLFQSVSVRNCVA